MLSDVRLWTGKILTLISLSVFSTYCSFVPEVRPGMKQLCPLILGILSLILISCGGGSAPPNPPSDPSAVTVSVSPSSASLQINFTTQSSQQFLATVTNATNLSVTWQVNGVTGGNASVGTITPSGLYYTPAAVPSPNPVTVTAVSVADPTKSASASVTIMPPVAVSISPATSNVQFGGTQQFTATVQNNSNTAVTWQVIYSTPLGSISSSGLYTAPASGALYSIVLISATSAVDSRVTAQATIILTGPPGPNDSELQGQYAFSLKGEDFFDAAHYPQEPKTIVGSFRADGLGNLEGAVDIVLVTTSGQALTGAISPSHAKIAGAYTVGADGRGSLALFSTDPNVGLGDGYFLPTCRFALGTVVQGVATQGRIIEFDSSPVNTGFTWMAVTGTIEKQDPSAFSTTAINGDFSFGFSADSFSAFAAVGRFHADGSGNISAGSLDTNATPLLLSNQSFTGSYGSVDGDGRGSAILVIPGVGNVTTAFYVVSNTELLFIGAGIPDNGGTVHNGSVAYSGFFAGPALRQTGGPYTNASLSGSSVFQLTGMNASGTSTEELIAGEFVADGKGNLTGVMDENINGSVSLNTVITGSYTIGANGRGTLTPQGGGEPFVLYMVSPGQAFLLDPPPGDPQIGLLQPQASGPFSNTSISGTFLGGTLLIAEVFDSLSAGTVTAAGEFTFDGAGNGSGTGDLSASRYINSTVGYMSPDQPFAATYTIAANGRGTMTVTSLAGGPYVLYVISPTSFFTMYVGPITSISVPSLVFTK